jgi:hypothetical protein
VGVFELTGSLDDAAQGLSDREITIVAKLIEVVQNER